MKRYIFRALCIFNIVFTFVFAAIFALSFTMLAMGTKQRTEKLNDRHGQSHSRLFDTTRTNPTTSRKFKHPVSIFCYTLTASVNHATRVPAVNDTWAKRCDDHYFFTDGPMPKGYKHFVTHQMFTDRDSAWKKLRIVIPFILRNISSDFEWYIRTSDDSYYIIENLRYFLKDYDPKIYHYFGFHMKPHLPQGYVSGSAIVFSRALMQLLVDTIIPDKKRCPEELPSLPDYRFDDVAIGRCLAAYAFYPEETRDVDFREMFHPFNHSEMYRGENNHGLVMYSKHPVKNGFDAFSRDLISSHYLTPQEMRLYETLLYRVRVREDFARGKPWDGEKHKWTGHV